MTRLYQVTARGYMAIDVHANSIAEAFDKAANADNEDWYDVEWDELIDAEIVEDVA